MGKIEPQTRSAQNPATIAGNVMRSAKNVIEGNIMKSNIMNSSIIEKKPAKGADNLFEMDKSMTTDVPEKTASTGGEAFYAVSGEFLGSFGDGANVRVVKAADVADVTEKINWANDPSEHGKTYAANNKSIAMEKSTDLDMTHDHFQKLSGLAAKEDFSKTEATMAIGSAQANRIKPKVDAGKSFDAAFNSFNQPNANKDDDGLHGYMLKNKTKYKEYWDKTPLERNNVKRMVDGQAAVINSWSADGKDLVNGGIGWQGLDVMKKYKSDGKSIWPAYKEWHMQKGFVWASDAIIGTGATMTPTTMPGVTIEGVTPAYKITASYGKTIFWKSNK